MKEFTKEETYNEIKDKVPEELITNFKTALLSKDDNKTLDAMLSIIDYTNKSFEHSDETVVYIMLYIIDELNDSNVNKLMINMVITKEWETYRKNFLQTINKFMGCPNSGVIKF